MRPCLARLRGRGSAQSRRLALGLASVVAALAGCGGGDEDGERPGVREALGGDAKVRTLARSQLAGRPPGKAAWVADELRLAAGRAVEHAHEEAFVYARGGDPLLTSGGRRRAIREGDSGFVGSGVRHTHSVDAGEAALWEIRLAVPDAPPPPAAKDARRVFESDPLVGIPARPLASFLLVKVPARGGRTTVHTHPGPEFVYQLDGRIDYQNEIVGTKRLGPGGAEAIPPGTAVQKRNPFPRDARFLSWFLVDPDKPFAPGARF